MALEFALLSCFDSNHSFLRWTCVCVMHLRKMTFKQMR
ncbi:Tfp pilus assembly protein [Vibrio cholerae]